MAGTTDFVTNQSIGTFAGATTTVWVVGNTVRLAVRRDWPLFPLATGLGVAFVLAGTAHQLHTPLDYLLAVLNGCLLFLTATGVQQATLAEVKSSEGSRRQGKGRVSWWAPWIPTRGAQPGESAPTPPAPAAAAPAAQASTTAPTTTPSES